MLLPCNHSQNLTSKARVFLNFVVHALKGLLDPFFFFFLLGGGCNSRNEALSTKF